MPRKANEKTTAKAIYATGKRKCAIARVRIFPGTGKVTINDKELEGFYALQTLRAVILKPFLTANTAEKYDVVASVKGGGFSAQAGAIAHGISKALSTTDGDVRTSLKKAGLLTRDSRVKERRKYGLKKARKAPQFSKR